MGGKGRRENTERTQHKHDESAGAGGVVMNVGRNQHSAAESRYKAVEIIRIAIARSRSAQRLSVTYSWPYLLRTQLPKNITSHLHECRHKGSGQDQNGLYLHSPAMSSIQ